MTKKPLVYGNLGIDYHEERFFFMAKYQYAIWTEEKLQWYSGMALANRVGFS
jgi:hypothetical protein